MKTPTPPPALQERAAQLSTELEGLTRRLAEDVHVLAQSLKSAATSEGDPRLSRLAEELEAGARLETWGACQALLAALRDAPSTAALFEGFTSADELVPLRPAEAGALPPSLLLVVADATLREDLARELWLLGVETEPAADDGAAVDWLDRGGRPHFVVTDEGDHQPVVQFLKALADPPPLIRLCAEGKRRARHHEDLRFSVGLGAEQLAKSISRIAQRPRFRLLVLSQAPSLLSATWLLLGSSRIQVEHLTDVYQLEATLERSAPDLLVLDLDQPKVDGLVLLARLRQTAQWAHLPVVLLSSQADADLRTRAFLTGADDFIQTPVKANELEARLEGRLRRVAALRSAFSLESNRRLESQAQFERALTRQLETAGGPVTVGLLQALPGSAGVDVVAASLETRLRSTDAVARVGTDAVAFSVLAPAASAKRFVGEALQGIPTGGLTLGLTDSVERLGADAPGLLQAAQAALAPLSVQGVTRRHSVLIADSDEHIRVLVRRLLERQGYEVEEAPDGTVALERLSRRVGSARFDLLVVDLHLPRRSGRELLESLPNISPSTRALVLSGQSRDPDVAAAFASGAADFVAKPFSATVLLARAARLLKDARP
jgi:DNA-binding response OmpR family regulator